jgi:hypothetical protein
VAITQRCLYCNEPLHWMKRSDAIYCKPRCRKAAHYASNLNPGFVKKTQINSPPLDYYPVTMDVWVITWSTAIPCEFCKRFVTTGFGMLYFRGALGWFGCDWPCLQSLTENRELDTDF